MKADARPASGLRVLIIDRQEETAASLAFMLAQHDTVVRIALDLAVGLDEAGRFAPELCIVDTGLLAVDGPRYVKALRQRCPVPPLLVAMSGFALPHDVQRASRAGFDRHFDAPPRPDELDRLLDEARQRSA